MLKQHLKLEYLGKVQLKDLSHKWFSDAKVSISFITVITLFTETGLRLCWRLSIYLLTEESEISSVSVLFNDKQNFSARSLYLPKVLLFTVCFLLPSHSDMIVSNVVIFIIKPPFISEISIYEDNHCFKLVLFSHSRMLLSHWQVSFYELQ